MSCGADCRCGETRYPAQGDESVIRTWQFNVYEDNDLDLTWIGNVTDTDPDAAALQFLSTISADAARNKRYRLIYSDEISPPYYQGEVGQILKEEEVTG